MIGRQLQHQQAGQALAPVGELRFQRIVPQPLALPDREIGVLDGQLGQRGGLPLDEGGVERCQLVPENPHRPAIADDVVHDQQQDVLVVLEAQQCGAQQRPTAQIDRPHPRTLRYQCYESSKGAKRSA